MDVFDWFDARDGVLWTVTVSTTGRLGHPAPPGQVNITFSSHRELIELDSPICPCEDDTDSVELVFDLAVEFGYRYPGPRRQYH